MSLEFRTLAFCTALIPLFFGSAPLFGASVDSFEPTIGSVGDQVTIRGSGFFPGTLVVRFNGVQDPTAVATAANGTLIQAQVPPGVPLGPGPITVQVNGGTPASSLGDFNVVGPGPYVTGFSPTTGGSGASVFIDGLNFNSAGVNQVLFNSTPAATFFVQSDIRINATVPTSATTGPITVRSPIGTNITITNFFVPPVITSFAPTNGRAGTNVLVRGTNFLGTLALSFGGVFSSNFTVLSNNAVLATVPTNAVTGIVRLFAPAGSALTSSNFTILPTIFGFNPQSGPVGTPVVITGANFTNLTTAVPTVRFNGVTASATTNVSFGQLTAVVPATTSGHISVMTSHGTAVSSSIFYLPARITSFTPTNSPPGSLVTITGVNFTNASAVTFNGVPAANFFVTNNTSIGAIVPFGFSTGPITVTTPAGSTNSSGLFYAPPGIVVFSPTHGLPGTNVTLTGTNFLGTKSVLFNGTPATFFVTNNTTIGAIVPVGAQTGPITVIAPAGTNTTAVDFVLDYTSDTGLAVTDAPDPVFVGSNLVYTIIIANNGPFPAPDVVLSNTLPATVTLKAATTSQGVLATNANPIIGNLGQIPVGNSATVILTVTPQSSGILTNIARISSDNIDPALSNNVTNTTTTVLPLPLLSIRSFLTNRLLRISWPIEFTNYLLEFKPTLTNAAWSNITTTPSSSATESFVIETNQSPSRFYRLRK